jgi:hypothetical protein
LKAFFRVIFERHIAEADIRSALERGGLPMHWADTLAAARKRWFHEDALWLAVERLPDNRYDLLVLKRNVEHLDDPADYMRFDEWRMIYAGFQATIEHLYSSIEQEITAMERGV